MAGSRTRRRRWTVAAQFGVDGMALRFCYAAGRAVMAFNLDCRPRTGMRRVAPSLIPKWTGDRVQTDRRDAASLAKLHRAGGRVADPMQVSRPRQLRDASTLVRSDPRIRV